MCWCTPNKRTPFCDSKGCREVYDLAVKLKRAEDRIELEGDLNLAQDAMTNLEICQGIAALRKSYASNDLLIRILNELEIRLLPAGPQMPSQRPRRSRRPNGTFDRNAYQRVYMRGARAVAHGAGKLKGERGIDYDADAVAHAKIEWSHPAG